MKPRFDHTTTSVAVHPDGAEARQPGPHSLSSCATPRSTPTRGLRSAWLKLQLFVAGVRHSNKLKLP